jgi:type III secretion system FlhB-like substrate exporter
VEPHTYSTPVTHPKPEPAPVRALGLAYDPQQGLPRVVFKAAGELAEQALKQGLHTSGPRVVRDGALLAQLYRLPLDGAIDASLFQAVAALLAHVLALNQQVRESRQPHDVSPHGESMDMPAADIESNVRGKEV